MNKSGVSVSKIVELLDLKVYTDNMDLKKRKIQSADINRPALQMAGYFDHFASERVQIIGMIILLALMIYANFNDILRFFF